MEYFEVEGTNINSSDNLTFYKVDDCHLNGLKHSPTEVGY